MQWHRLVLALATGAALAGCESVSSEAGIEHYVAGRLAMEKHQYEAALAELERAIQADPKLSIAHSAMGDIYRKQGANELAAGAYTRACRANPYAFLPHYNLGVTLQILADAAETAQVAARHIRKAVQVYLRAVTLKPKDFDTNLNLSACYFQQGKLELAEEYCKAAIALDGDNPFAHSNLGTICDAQGRPYDAIGAYKASLELNVHQPKLLLNLGSTYMQLRRLKDALRAFELAAKEDPKCAEAYVQIGACHYHKRQWDEALAAYEQAVRIDPRSAAGLRGKGVVLMTRYIVNKEPDQVRDQALDAWHRSLELDSNQPDLLRLVQKYRPKLTGPPL